MSSTLHAPARAPSDLTVGGAFRPDIQGLRALAVTAVVLYHVGLFWLPGGFVGVDVFFVISGFLITGHLARNLERTGNVDFAEFYANRIRRLLPAASVVLVATTGMTYLFLPITRWEGISRDVIASAVYGENWRLATGSVNYLTQGELPSPVQHFWSLGVEEQFYVLWPLLLALAGFAVLRRGRPTRSADNQHLPRALLVALAAVAVPSFVWSVLYTTSDPRPAYFVSTTRLWELAIGGGVALLARRLAGLPQGAGVVLAWGGIAGIALSFFVIDSSTPFPGSWAALPALATAAAIGGGFTAGRAGPGALLSSWPAQWLGNMSYSIYLWHWPLVIVATVKFGTIDLPVAMGIIVGTLALSYVSWRFIEEKTRHAHWWVEPSQAIGLGVAMVASTAIVGVMLGLVVQSDEGQHPGTGGAAPPAGARVLPEDPRNATAGLPADTSKTIVPSPLLASKDVEHCPATDVGETTISRCAFGDPHSRVHVALVGDSHALQWLSALAPMAEDRGWALTGYIHYACPFASGALVREGKPYTDCSDWNTAVTEKLLADKQLAAVITSNYTDSATLAGSLAAVPQMAKAYEASWSKFTRIGVPVIALRDTPEAPMNVSECVAEHETSLTKCDFPRSAATDDRGVALMTAARNLPGATAVDLNDAICPTEACAPVIGQTLVYRDANHVTGTYIASLSPRLARAISGIRGLR